MNLIQRSFLLWPKLWISPQLFLGKIFAYSSKCPGNVRDPRLGLPWNWYFVRYHQSPPLILHVLTLLNNGSGYSKFFWTWTRIQYTLKHSRNNPQPSYFGVRRRQKKKPLSLDQGPTMDGRWKYTYKWDFAPFENHLWAQQNEEWESVWEKVVTKMRMNFPREKKSKVT